MDKVGAQVVAQAAIFTEGDRANYGWSIIALGHLPVFVDDRAGRPDESKAMLNVVVLSLSNRRPRPGATILLAPGLLFTGQRGDCPFADHGRVEMLWINKITGQ